MKRFNVLVQYNPRFAERGDATNICQTIVAKDEETAVREAVAFVANRYNAFAVCINVNEILKEDS